MSTSDEHERILRWLVGCIDDYFLAQGIAASPRGEATMRLTHGAGAEPDDAWTFGEPKEFPDVVLEVALTSGGLPKLTVYQRFAISEVWIWRKARLEIHRLREDSEGYDRVERSLLVPGLPIPALEAAVAERDWLKARRSFRAQL